MESQLEQLRLLRGKPIADVTDAELAKLIASKYNNVAAAGAELSAAGRREKLLPDLVAAFDRFAENGERNDKGCVAKLALVNALCALDHRDSDVYLRGVHLKQMEASWGKPVDTAGELRGRFAEALVACLYPNALLEIAPILMDAEGQARVGAARAAARVPGEGGAALLRLKLVAGDAEPVVLFECCAGLLRADADLHAAYVAALLQQPGTEVAQAALEALAECRSPAAFAALRAAYENATTAEGRKATLAAIARQRIDGVPEYLLELVEKSLHPRAREVVESLIVRKDDERFRIRLNEALARRDDAFLTRYATEVMARSR